MATQTDQSARSSKSKTNSHSHNSYEIPPEMASKSPIKVTEPQVTDEQHRELVAVAAYYLAERRNFEPGHEAEDWLAAELQVRRAATRIA
jgi:hypothetical protein